jgi:hypothetical protein
MLRFVVHCNINTSMATKINTRNGSRWRSERGWIISVMLWPSLQCRLVLSTVRRWSQRHGSAFCWSLLLCSITVWRSAESVDGRYASKLGRWKRVISISITLVGTPQLLIMWTGNRVIMRCIANLICSKCGYLSSHRLSVFCATGRNMGRWYGSEHT